MYHEITHHLICFARLFWLKRNGYIIVSMCRNWCPSVARWNEMFKELPREGVKFHSPEINRGLSCCLSFAWPKLQYIRYTFFFLHHAHLHTGWLFLRWLCFLAILIIVCPATLGVVWNIFCLHDKTFWTFKSDTQLNFTYHF